MSGGSFGLILPRSIDFMQLVNCNLLNLDSLSLSVSLCLSLSLSRDSLKSFFFIRGLYPDPVDFTIMISLLNMIWSRYTQTRNVC